MLIVAGPYRYLIIRTCHCCEIQPLISQNIAISIDHPLTSSRYLYLYLWLFVAEPNGDG